MMTGLIPEWQEQDSDFGKCDTCKSLIVGKEYALFLRYGSDPLDISYADTTICELCMTQINIYNGL
jgi:hypothetical protein